MALRDSILRARVLSNDAEMHDYLHFTAVEAGSTVSYYANDSTKVQYSLDKNNWTELNNITVTLSDVGTKIYFKGTRNGRGSAASLHSYFITTGKVNVAGDISTLIKGEFEELDISSKERVFMEIFQDTHIIDASKLYLPANKLSLRCYTHMFRRCTLLTVVPILPIAILAQECYSYMFAECSSLTIAPILPITELAPYCYSYMFDGCTSLETAPNLPATILANYCYRGMFNNCTHLINPPELPATILSNGCYSDMFGYCTSLVTAPLLPAKTLVPNCYSGMFNRCKYLTYVELLAETTATRACSNFIKDARYGADPLIIKIHVKTWDTDCFYDWLLRARYLATGTIYVPTGCDAPTGTSGIPSGWTKVEF